MKTLAIIGPTASGKTDLAHTLARQFGAAVLSCDSLSVFKGIDIASAKPSKEERRGIDYFGLDLIEPCGRFGVDAFVAEFERARQFCQTHNKALIIAGGTGFYLKALIDGLSIIPDISDDTAKAVAKLLENPAKAHAKLAQIDSGYAAQIQPADRYRIEKGLLIALATHQPPSRWFETHPPQGVLKPVAIFEVDWPAQTLRDRIAQRTRQMLQAGLIDEVARLERHCPRDVQAMRSIGIAEVLDFFDAKVPKGALETLIATHTAQLAKRQRTFNRGQFRELVSLPGEAILERAQGLLR